MTGRPETVRCEECGAAVPVATRGAVPRFCPPPAGCQQRAWVKAHAEIAARSRHQYYLRSPAAVLEGNLRRAKARSAALSELARRHPDEYRALYLARLGEADKDLPTMTEGALS